MALFDDLTKKAAKFTEEAIDKTQEFYWCWSFWNEKSDI